jgi:hypothetical protein
MRDRRARLNTRNLDLMSLTGDELPRIEWMTLRDQRSTAAARGTIARTIAHTSPLWL